MSSIQGEGSRRSAGLRVVPPTTTSFSTVGPALLGLGVHAIHSATLFRSSAVAHPMGISHNRHDLS
eukprot:7493441-Pyramimonas_sp.AAC.1